MPYAQQLGIGFTADSFDLVEKELGVYINFGRDPAHPTTELLPLARVSEIDALLWTMHERLLAEHPRVTKVHGRTEYKKTDCDPKGSYIHVTMSTDGVERDVWAAPMSLRAVYDPVEVGHEPEDAMISVDVTSRYMPTLIDLDNEHGQTNTIAKWQRALVEKTHVSLCALFPAFREADWVLCDYFY